MKHAKPHWNNADMYFKGSAMCIYLFSLVHKHAISIGVRAAPPSPTSVLIVKVRPNIVPKRLRQCFLCAMMTYNTRQPLAPDNPRRGDTFLGEIRKLAATTFAQLGWYICVIGHWVSTIVPTYKSFRLTFDPTQNTIAIFGYWCCLSTATFAQSVFAHDFLQLLQITLRRIRLRFMVARRFLVMPCLALLPLLFLGQRALHACDRPIVLCARQIVLCVAVVS